MSPAEIVDRLAEDNPEALLLDGYQDALVGVAARCGQPTLAVYSLRRLIEITAAMVAEADPEADAWAQAADHVHTNVVGGWVGEHTPLVLDGLV